MSGRAVGFLVSVLVHLGLLLPVMLWFGERLPEPRAERPVSLTLAMFRQAAPPPVSEPEPESPPGPRAPEPEPKPPPVAETLPEPDVAPLPPAPEPVPPKVAREPTAADPPPEPEKAPAPAPEPETARDPAPSEEVATAPVPEPPPRKTTVRSDPPVPPPRAKPAPAKKASAPRQPQAAPKARITPPPAAAVRAAPKAPPPTPPAAVAAMEASYLDNVRQRIEANKFYPVRAQRMHQQGTAVLRLVLLSDGSIGAVSLATSSGTPLLDNAAVEAVRRVAQFPPFPPELGRSDWVLTVPVRYSLM